MQPETTASPPPVRTRFAITALQTRLFGADLEWDEGQWIAETRQRRLHRLGTRDWQYSFTAASCFVVFAVLTAILIDSHRPVSLFVIVSMVCAYALAATVEFEVGAGSAVPTQLVLVPMLFLLPLGLVPACVAAGLLLGDLPRYIRREAHPKRAIIAVTNAWYVAGPVIVLWGFAETTPRISHWHIYLLALLSQFAFDFAIATCQSWYAFGTPPGSQLTQMASVCDVTPFVGPLVMSVRVGGEHASRGRMPRGFGS